MSTKLPLDEGAASCNANDVLMLRAQLKSLEERTVITNKSVLQTEKGRDKLHKQLELIEVQLQGKRARTHYDDDTGDGHDMHTEVDELDLSDFHRETTRVQNRRNVALGSLHDQPKPHTGKDDLLVSGYTRTKQTSCTYRLAKCGQLKVWSSHHVELKRTHKCAQTNPSWNSETT